MSAAQAVTMLKLAYRSEFPDDRALFYGMELARFPDSDVEEAVRSLILTSRFLPSIAEIGERIAERALNLPTTEEAWIIAERGNLKDAAEPVRIAAEHVGGRWAITKSDNIDTVRAQFRKAYESARAQAFRDYVTPRALPPGIAPPELLGPTMKALPESQHFRPRPVFTLWMKAQTLAYRPEEITDEEKRDAIEVLKEGPVNGYEDPLYVMAERIFRDAAS
jgi:hypothetical protein